MRDVERDPDDIEIEPDEWSDDPVELLPEFDELDEEGLEDEWEEDALEGGQ